MALYGNAAVVEVDTGPKDGAAKWHRAGRFGGAHRVEHFHGRFHPKDGTLFVSSAPATTYRARRTGSVTSTRRSSSVARCIRYGAMRGCTHFPRGMMNSALFFLFSADAGGDRRSRLCGMKSRQQRFTLQHENFERDQRLAASVFERPVRMR